ncbi:MAG: phage holin family protein [Pseudomonadota bacterium]|nr:phage holin family protein [Pseudomonadota bacterium]
MADYGERLDEAARLSASGPDKPSIADEVRQLIAAARQFADAELAYQKTRAGLMAKAAAAIAGFGALALALLFFGLMAVVVGLLLALAPLLGPWGAMAVVVGGLLIATLIAGLLAWRGVTRFMALLHDDKDAG